MRAVGVVIALAAITAVPAAAADPRVAPGLTASGGRQSGSPVWVTDAATAPSHGACTVWNADYTAQYPDAVRHDGSALTWRIADARKPATVSVLLARAGLDDSGLGPTESLPVTLRPVRSHGRTVAWTATSTTSGYGDLHLDVSVEWPAGPCGKDAAAFRYHVLALPV